MYLRILRLEKGFGAARNKQGLCCRVRSLPMELPPKANFVADNTRYQPDVLVLAT